MNSPTPTIDATGIHVPGYFEVLESLKVKYRSIYGADVYLEADSQDGQFLAVMASAINDANAAIVAAYAGFSPATAMGEVLSSVVKINGIQRHVASQSTADLRLVGQAGTTIHRGLVQDENGNQWMLPEKIVIPPQGEIIATATCQKMGTIAAAKNTINKIITPTRGWQSASNPAAAVAGAPIESDASLRERQSKSVSAPSRSVWEGIIATVSALPGVTRLGGVENDTGSPDANGVPGHSIALVVEGGDVDDIASAILRKKSPGCGTAGNTEAPTLDQNGIARLIRFSRPTLSAIKATVSIKAFAGYESQVGADIQQAIADYINALHIGGSVMLTRLYLPANLYGRDGSQTYELLELQIGVSGGELAAVDIAIPFDGVATCQAGDVQIVVTK